MALIGLDVGFSAKRATSGVARLGLDGGLRLGHTTSAWESRRGITGTEPADIAAIDAPYTTAGASERRDCERVFTLGAFQRRCKPGLSDIPGTGRDFRAAGWGSAQQLKPIVPRKSLAADFPRIEDCNVVEAFPNAYLGVCLPADAYAEIPRPKRGKKFDWLYDSWGKRDLFRQVIDEIGLEAPGDLDGELGRNTQHDERAALVCLLTAAGVYAGRYTAVGESTGGYFFLPPWARWAAWAREELDRQRVRVLGLDVWIAGRRYSSADAIPLTT